MPSTTNQIFGTLPGRRCWLLLLLLLGLGAGPAARAQSGPYGNEWIVPGQQYYKVRIVKDGLYKLSYQYLTQAGIRGVVPNELQVWRRGQQIATYVGGNRTTLDPSTYLEFYAVHNDARLDAELYKSAADQPHQLFSLYTDTAAYFITWRAGTPARHMPEPAAAGGSVHPHRLLSKLDLRINVFSDYPTQTNDVYLPWMEPGEGFFMGVTKTELQYTIDSVAVSPPAGGGPPPRLEVSLFGSQNRDQRYGGVGIPHSVQVLVVPPGGTERVLGTLNFVGLVRALGRFDLQAGDVSAAGQVVVKLRNQPVGAPGNYFYAGYLRTTAPQASVWFPARHQLAFANDSLLAGPATYELAGVPASVAGFDIQDFNNVQRVAGTPGAAPGSTRFVFPAANAGATHRLLLADEGFLPEPPLPARRVVFRTINPAQPNFIVITHPLLQQPAPGTGNAARAYAGYRASAAGGRYDTLVVNTFQLYDQFMYGEKSWLALRHFARWLAAAGPAGRDRYLLLLGKGIVPSEPVRGAYFARNGEFGLDLVPSSSRAVSDNLLTADYANGDYVAQLHTGRLTATTPQQIMTYLAKVRTHDALGPAAWRKNVLHLIGAKDAGETQEFTQYMAAEEVRIERPLLGGTVTTQTRTGALPVSVDISAELNAGLSVIDYFGHGSNNIFSLNFGAPSTAPNYNNPGKYPVLFLNGCAGNATCVQTYTVVEDYLFADQKGAIGSLGESGFSFAYPLSIALDSMHRLLFNDPQWYGRPVTVVHDEVVRRLQRSIYFSDDIGIEQLLCTSWQGDPTIALYAPPLPDYVASAATLSVAPVPGQGPVKATSTAFVLNVGVSNPGKITTDRLLEISVSRTQGTLRSTLTFPVRQAWRADTTYALTIPNAFVGSGGLSTLVVTLDPANKIAESNEGNNTAQLDFAFLTGGLAPLSPTEFAIVPTTTPRLVVQSNNPAEATRAYEFELDTDPAFGSAAPLKQRATITAGVLAEWQPTALPPTVAGRDSVVWYWRARFQTPAAGEDGSWVTSSFRLIPNSPAGWSQSHYGQFQRDALTGVAVGGPRTSWTFTPQPIPLVLRTVGGGTPRSAPQFGNLLGAGIYLQSAGLPVVGNCAVQSPNLLLAVYDGNTLRPLVMPATYQRCGQGPNYFYFFSTAATSAVDTLDNLNYSATRQQQLDAFLTAIPSNAYVAVVSTNRLRYSLLPPALKARLQTLLGSRLITTLADGEPLALVGQKLSATTGRLLQEQGPDRASTTPGYNQRIELSTTLPRPGTSGRVLSTLIGPAQQWNNLYTTLRTLNTSGQYTLRVVGVDAQGTETTVLPSVPLSPTAALNTQSLSTVSAQTYPYLRLDLTLADTARVAPQLQQWLVTARGLPEGVVQRDAVPASTYAAATLLAQATSGRADITFPVKFRNVSAEPFSGPLRTRVQVRSNGVVVAGPVFIDTPAPLPGETATINASINVAGKYGDLTIEAVVNPRLQPEQNYANNELILPPFSVGNNNVPPTLDVAVDGRHILNGEIVSSTPDILVQLNDEDRIVHVRSRDAFTLTLQRPGQSTPTLVPLTGADIEFRVDSTNGSRATLLYRPGKNAPLPDGKYTLRVQGRDPGNAAAAAQELQISFEVVGAATISNVYPYPNPVISKARFVFTVTGHDLPRNLKIQIMSLTGRVVREIFMSELGPLHIGNNITDYAWDGTDTYGDRLANGTYLYRVAYDNGGVDFGRRDTAGDKAFKNDWGKLVLMR